MAGVSFLSCLPCFLAAVCRRIWHGILLVRDILDPWGPDEKNPRFLDFLDSVSPMGADKFLFAETENALG